MILTITMTQISQILLAQTLKLNKTNCKIHQSYCKCSFKVTLFDLIASNVFVLEIKLFVMLLEQKIDIENESNIHGLDFQIWVAHISPILKCGFLFKIGVL